MPSAQKMHTAITNAKRMLPKILFDISVYWRLFQTTSVGSGACSITILLFPSCYYYITKNESRLHHDPQYIVPPS